MRINRQRRRTLDPLAHPDVIRHMLDRLRELLPAELPKNEKHLLKMLLAVRHLERRQATDTRRGRPSPWKRTDLIKVASCLRVLLDRETSGRVSLNSFLGLYIRVLEFPADVTETLISGDTNLFEAAQLARMNAKRLGVSASEARRRRERVLLAHLLVQGSGQQLRARINDLLGDAAESGKNFKNKNDWGFTVVDELLEVDPYDSRHLFWEELRRIALAIHQVTPEDVTDKILEELLPVIDKLSSVLMRLEKQRSQEIKGKLIV